MDPKELEDLKHRLDDSYIPGSGFLNPWDDYRKERIIPLKADSEYTLDDLKNMLDIIINIAKSNNESEQDIVNMLIDALDKV